jgi:nucleotide-binding universal stress UspA family protein
METSLKEETVMTSTLEKKTFNKIIILTDFSEAARNAIKYAIDAFGNEVEYELVNSYYARTSSATLLDINDMLAKDSETGLAGDMEWIKEQYPDLDLTINVLSLFGSPVDAIRKLHKNITQDLVIMGTKGASGIDAVLFGSTAATVIRTTVVPVISVPPSCSFKGFNEIVLTTDGSDNYGDSVFDPLEKMQTKFGSKVTVLTIENDGKKVDLQGMDFPFEVNMYTKLQDKNIVDTIVNYCEEDNADLMVLTPQHTGFFERLFHKSISKELVTRASMPILSLENA